MVGRARRRGTRPSDRVKGSSAGDACRRHPPRPSAGPGESRPSSGRADGLLRWTGRRDGQASWVPPIIAATIRARSSCAHAADLERNLALRTGTCFGRPEWLLLSQLPELRPSWLVTVPIVPSVCRPCRFELPRRPPLYSLCHTPLSLLSQLWVTYHQSCVWTLRTGVRAPMMARVSWLDGPRLAARDQKKVDLQVSL